MMLGRFQIQHGTRTRAQYVVNADFAVFVVAGSGNLITGPAHAAETDYFEDKDFIYIGRGEIFAFENTGDTPCTLIFAYVGEDRLEDFQRTFVEEEKK